MLVLSGCHVTHPDITQWRLLMVVATSGGHRREYAGD